MVRVTAVSDWMTFSSFNMSVSLSHSKCQLTILILLSRATLPARAQLDWWVEMSKPSERRGDGGDGGSGAQHMLHNRQMGEHKLL